MTPAASHDLAFVGSFTTPQRLARGLGVEVCRIDPASGAWRSLGCQEGLVNPSFLITDPVRRTLYAVHADLDYATAFAVDPTTGALRPLGKAATGGVNGVHLTLDPSGRFLIVANYASGALAVLPVRPDGSLGDFTQLFALPGPNGPHRLEQGGAHPHHVVFDPTGRFLLAPDKGLDRVFVLRFDADLGRLSLADEGCAIMRPGAGPRHIAFHPHQPFAFVINELDSTLVACGWDAEAGVLTPLYLASTLPPDFFAANTASAVVVSPDGTSVYASNRGQDAVAHFTFDADTARLAIAGWTPSEGAVPRFMTLNPAGDRLYVANEQGDAILAFDLAPAGGALIRRGVVLRSASPGAIAFL